MLGKLLRDSVEAIRSPRRAIAYLYEMEPIHYFTGKKLTHDDLSRFGTNFSRGGEALVVHAEIDCSDLFDAYTSLPDHYMEYDRYLDELAAVPDESYQQVVAMGVLEHVSDPAKLIDECHRVLAPGGTLYVSASFAFSIHNGPENYFHVTPYGMELLLDDQDWTAIDVRGSCGPFKTIGILLQRILLQSRTNPIIRPLVALLAYAIPYFDRFVVSQYDHVSCSRGSEIDSMLPSNVQLVATKSELRKRDSDDT